MDYKKLSESDLIVLRVAIGQQVSELLDLKVNKKTGWVKTSHGKKSIQGLGSAIIRIIESEITRVTE